ncbi:type II toxin-antitoxin system VapC family toxin [Cellvibrio sp. PSBB023]|uniref:type II toxin-antitoxin system tRNA(fMet)-specific endonuclease VapC n=1 Tax=Cellvibrio sp. PSBB023 TaxID=1945512 RepID=UPI00098EF8C7|nr:type II toxin-antitoxin system VapC family toxin [Cellvibrio sp. PSBB023]AQT60965.1 VapC toxin family PIN domain ribonuclease [Cellvibrio sp. PSBB023]
MTIRYLLDTNICIYIAKYNPASVRARFAQHSANELAMSVITLGELRFGAEKSHTKDQAMAVIDELASLMNVEELGDGVTEHYGDIRARLQKSGQIIGNNDLWLAAHARSQDWVLVTNNEKEFVRVDGLRVENWV